jgi:hypothetical protein
MPFAPGTFRAYQLGNEVARVVEHSRTVAYRDRRYSQRSTAEQRRTAGGTKLVELGSGLTLWPRCRTVRKSELRKGGCGRVLAWNSEREYDGKDGEGDTDFED